MKTSSFSRYQGCSGINITTPRPSWYICKSYPSLFPPRELVVKYYKDGNELEYSQAYRERVLDKLDPQEVYDDLKDSVLLSYEKATDFNHRRLVAEWIQDSLGIKVEEISVSEEDRVT